MSTTAGATPINDVLSTAINLPPGWPTPLSARSLSWLAEESEGRRDQDLLLVEHSGDGGAVTIELIKKEDLDPQKHRRLADVRTDSLRPDRVKIEKLTLKPEGAPAWDVPSDWDAFFWTEASIEKFFFPYYFDQRLLEEADWQHLKDAFARKELIGFAHVTPSRPVEVGTADPGVALHMESGRLVATGVIECVAKLKRRLNSAGADHEAAGRAKE